MRVTLTTRVETTAEFDVELPLFRKHVIDTDDGVAEIRTMITPCSRHSFLFISITRRELWNPRGIVAWELEQVPHYQFPHGEADYVLGRGFYACTEEEFLEYRKQAMQSFLSITVPEKTQ